MMRARALTLVLCAATLTAGPATASGSAKRCGQHPRPTNPSFATDLTGWTVSSGTLTRDTSVYDTAPASAKWTRMETSGTLTGSFTGTFVEARTYGLHFAMRADGPAQRVTVKFGRLGVDRVRRQVQTSPTWKSYVVTWTPDANRIGVSFRVSGVLEPFGLAFHIDSLKLNCRRP